jgi:hypothetical protein
VIPGYRNGLAGPGWPRNWALVQACVPAAHAEPGHMHDLFAQQQASTVTVRPACCWLRLHPKSRALNAQSPAAPGRRWSRLGVCVLRVPLVWVVVLVAILNGWPTVSFGHHPSSPSGMHRNAKYAIFISRLLIWIGGLGRDQDPTKVRVPRLAKRYRRPLRDQRQRWSHTQHSGTLMVGAV